MANELTLSSTLAFAKDSRRASVNHGSFNDTVAGTDYIQATQVVTTTQAALEKGNITTPGWFIGRNLSSTAGEIIHIRPATGGTNMVEIGPGLEVQFKFSSTATAPFVISATGSPELEFTLIEA